MLSKPATNTSGITDSRQALAVFNEFSPDLVAIDLRMPYIDGFSLLKQLHRPVRQAHSCHADFDRG